MFAHVVEMRSKFAAEHRRRMQLQSKRRGKTTSATEGLMDIFRPKQKDTSGVDMQKLKERLDRDIGQVRSVLRYLNVNGAQRLQHDLKELESLVARKTPSQEMFDSLVYKHPIVYGPRLIEAGISENGRIHQFADKVLTSEIPISKENHSWNWPHDLYGLKAFSTKYDHIYSVRTLLDLGDVAVDDMLDDFIDVYGSDEERYAGENLKKIGYSMEYPRHILSEKGAIAHSAAQFSDLDSKLDTFRGRVIKAAEEHPAEFKEHGHWTFLGLDLVREAAEASPDYPHMAVFMAQYIARHCYR